MEMINSKFLTVKNLDILLGSRTILSNICFDAKRGEFISILGKSGIGKSSLLKAIAGYLPTKNGIVMLDNREIIEPNSLVNYMHQTYELFPWLSVFQNVYIAIKYNNDITDLEKNSRTKNLLKLVGLHEYSDYKPHQLSGGMKQRTALARALNANAEVILMDEPFNSLDTVTKQGIIDFIADIRSRYNKLFMMVSHDIEDSIYLSDRIFILGGAPANIVKEYTIPISHPRGYLTRSTPEFISLRQEILNVVLGA